MEKKLSCIVQNEDEGRQLGSILRLRLGLTQKEISRAKFRENGICVNKEQRKVNAVLSAGDLIEVILDTGESVSAHLLSWENRVSVLYEDEDVLVVNKPAGLVTHPVGAHYQDTLANALAAYLRERKEDCVIRILGRLDKDTSGVILAVKNRPAGTRLARQREKGLFSKSYLAVTLGRPKPEKGRICVPIGPDAKYASTYYETVQSLGAYSLVRLKLDTGRTHQIRVHMAHIGCPLLGDPLYGEGSCAAIGRTALHAESLTFCRPFTGERLCIEAPLPEDIKALL